MQLEDSVKWCEIFGIPLTCTVDHTPQPASEIKLSLVKFQHALNKRITRLIFISRRL